MTVFQRRNEVVGVDSFRICPAIMSSVRLQQHQRAFVHELVLDDHGAEEEGRSCKVAQERSSVAEAI
jgi:hypothetical protein